MPILITNGMRQCQIEAIRNLEESFAENHPRALIQMATGAGKTFTAVSFIYRLIKHADAQRVLFLVNESEFQAARQKLIASKLLISIGSDWNPPPTNLINDMRLAI
jgi:type I restriction enzyme R subunit